MKRSRRDWNLILRDCEHTADRATTAAVALNPEIDVRETYFQTFERKLREYVAPDDPHVDHDRLRAFAHALAESHARWSTATTTPNP